MDNKIRLSNGHNNSIGCIVNECKFHSRDNYCELERINVVKHEATANTVECTDCGSFEKM
ncbi:DUF1540 domain-containing protein [Clostridium cellulovorans]|uniref:DUF1540 domain-containing protein n=1 Tax=Clostridium cellulovorans (strain ATCC 35296 / DSM 3052 / OCM 3 / 743B) TaxID=573061 RepID=D9SN25_CLOC7|nr:DUF1540 domain-containing protein [Clostridium cellulovorans]ADL51891.1 protein of unknown function DUF1540 [Clostridium cellulovorans 743B]